jgi:hypothetical protein
VRAAQRLGLVERRASPLDRVALEVERRLGRLAAFNDPRHLYYYCNCSAP